MITALIVDDEPLFRAHLRRLLERQEVEIVGEADNGPMGLRMAEDLLPDVILLDICIPDMSGMQMAAALLHLHKRILLVFVTSDPEYAVAAFEHDALDYLVKPVAPERLARTLIRVRERLADRRARQQTTELTQNQTVNPPLLRRLPVREDYAVRLVKMEEVLYATTRDKRVFIRTAEGEFRSCYTLAQLETMLPSDRFLRIHDSWLVNLEVIKELLFLGNHNYMVRLENNQQIPVGRTRYLRLQRSLGLNALPAA